MAGCPPAPAAGWAVPAPGRDSPHRWTPLARGTGSLALRSKLAPFGGSEMSRDGGDIPGRRSAEERVSSCSCVCSAAPTVLLSHSWGRGEVLAQDSHSSCVKLQAEVWNTQCTLETAPGEASSRARQALPRSCSCSSNKQYSLLTSC